MLLYSMRLIGIDRTCAADTLVCGLCEYVAGASCDVSIATWDVNITKEKIGGFQS
jgi:hypothetical protein